MRLLLGTMHHPSDRALVLLGAVVCANLIVRGAASGTLLHCTVKCALQRRLQDSAGSDAWSCARPLGVTMWRLLQSTTLLLTRAYRSLTTAFDYSSAYAGSPSAASVLLLRLNRTCLYCAKTHAGPALVMLRMCTLSFIKLFPGLCCLPLFYGESLTAVTRVSTWNEKLLL